jgi:SAM-dependent methyltransferase
MDTDHLRELIELEESYWWHDAKRRLVIELLQAYAPQPPGLIIEGGIGSSRTLLEFKKLGYEVAGLDLMPEAVAHAHSRGILNAKRHDLLQPWPFERASAQAVVLLDVIEHISDPVTALSLAREVLAPNGILILTVPAYPWLYSSWDKILGHYRRYTPQSLCSETTAAGFQAEFRSYWNSFTLPAACAVRTVQRLRPPRGQRAEFPRVGELANRLLRGMAAVERWWLRRASVPAGLSLVGVYR